MEKKQFFLSVWNTDPNSTTSASDDVDMEIIETPIKTRLKTFNLCLEITFYSKIRFRRNPNGVSNESEHSAGISTVWRRHPESSPLPSLLSDKGNAGNHHIR